MYFYSLAKLHKYTRRTPTIIKKCHSTNWAHKLLGHFCCFASQTVSWHLHKITSNNRNIYEKCRLWNETWNTQGRNKLNACTYSHGVIEWCSGSRSSKTKCLGLINEKTGFTLMLQQRNYWRINTKWKEDNLQNLTPNTKAFKAVDPRDTELGGD